MKRMKQNEEELGNIEELEKKGDVTRESNSGWCFPDCTNPNPDRVVVAMFVAMVDLAISRGKKS